MANSEDDLTFKVDPPDLAKKADFFMMVALHSGH